MSRPPTPRRWQTLATVAVCVLAAAGTLLGLLVDGFYTDPETLVTQAVGQDAVTLVAVLPLLAGGLWFARRGSLRGYVVWLGSLGYVLYTYAVYAVVTQFNAFFLGYVALFGLALFTFVGGLLQVDPAVVRDRVAGDLPVRAASWFLAGMGVLVAGLWLSEVVPATLAGTAPPSVVESELPSNPVHVLDLAVLVPALFVTARWLRRGRAWGYVLAGVLFVKLASIGGAVLAMAAFLASRGDPVPPAQLAVFVGLTLANLAFGVRYLLAVEEA